ncbi:MAG: hypothetical protein B7Y12_04875 [Rhizobiales bacterium 24-66-13]|jgi:hypothetical protein|nr:MAG: hypothetical protein B7Y61_02200 [Rhizobiales bacterium 35-66-30]OYZ82109.1 MAG: hypothetical protein B7Y12_04875 [Rhizobiales bacterium 24-66-13]OZB11382.1 MAG: hypothetical protein B7X67_03995 [Rhizobiales bacterium 39-66-18]HQS45741.1 hypothetical protein [Xanthobacteraceae bacterium]
MIRHLLVAAMMALSPLTAQAQQNGGEELMVARCAQGGCRCALVDITQDDLAFLLGPDIPARAMRMTLVSVGGKTYFSPRSADEVHRAAGGTGRCEVKLFEPMTPLDGMWRSSVRVSSMSGCLPQVAEMVPPIIDDMGATVPVTWNGRFDPTKLDGGGVTRVVEWTETAPGRFKGHINIPNTGMLKVDIGLTSTLLTPERATATMHLRIGAGAGANAAALSALGMANCRTTAVYDFTRVGK